MEITELEAQEYAEFKAAKLAKEQAVRTAEQRALYKEMVDDEIAAVVPELHMLSEQIANTKRDVYDRFKTILELKSELFKVDSKQMTHTFTNTQGNMRLSLGYRTNDGYDDTVNEGIAIVYEYISSLASDSKSQMLVKTILKLLSRNEKGDLKASRVMQLRQMANESGDAKFLEGVQIIEDAYSPVATKQYISVAVRDPETGNWDTLPLSITDAQIKSMTR